MLKFSCVILFGKHYFSPLNTFMRKGRIWSRIWIFELDTDPYLWLMDPVCPKTCGSGSPTLSHSQKQSPPLQVTHSEPEGHHCKVLALEANIWDGGKTVHVVFKNLSRFCCRYWGTGKGWGHGVGEEPLSPLTTTLFSSWSVNISFKDDVTVILLLGASRLGSFIKENDWYFLYLEISSSLYLQNPYCAPQISRANLPTSSTSFH